MSQKKNLGLLSCVISSAMAAAERSCYFSVAVVRHYGQAAYRREIENLLGAYGSEGESMTTRAGNMTAGRPIP